MEQSPSQGTASPKPVTTFVQADSTSFRDVVQRLTGPVLMVSEPASEGPTTTKTETTAKKLPCKLHERRQSSKPGLQIEKPAAAPACTFVHEYSNDHEWQILSSASVVPVSPGFSPSPTNFSYPISPISTPNRNKREASVLSDEDLINPAEEEKAIKERRFYLHPSPRSKPGGYTQPELLTLFPLVSPNTYK